MIYFIGCNNEKDIITKEFLAIRGISGLYIYIYIYIYMYIYVYTNIIIMKYTTFY